VKDRSGGAVKNLLVTGGLGNLGQALINHSRETLEVDSVDVGDWDTLEQVFSRGIHVVIHAAHDLKTAAWDAPSKILNSNLGITGELLERSLRGGVQKFVYISSSAVYGDAPNSDESRECRPLTLYGKIKLLNEELVETFCQHHAKDYLIIRLFNLYGGHDRFSVLFRVAEAVRTGKPFCLNNRGQSMRDFIHVADASQAIVELALRANAHPRLNLGTGRATRMADLIDRARQAVPELSVVWGKNTEIEYSRADTTRLEQEIPVKFRHIEDCVEDELALLLGARETRPSWVPLSASELARPRVEPLH
jgi:UDP-glucose 4-epimerase